MLYPFITGTRILLLCLDSYFGFKLAHSKSTVITVYIVSKYYKQNVHLDEMYVK